MTVAASTRALLQARCANPRCGAPVGSPGMLLFKYAATSSTGSTPVVVEIDCRRCKQRNRILLGAEPDRRLVPKAAGA